MSTTPQPKRKTLTLRADLELYDRVDEMRHRQRISAQEFLRQAIIRHLAYSNRKGSTR